MEDVSRVQIGHQITRGLRESFDQRVVETRIGLLKESDVVAKIFGHYLCGRIRGGAVDDEVLERSDPLLQRALLNDRTDCLRKVRGGVPAGGYHAELHCPRSPRSRLRAHDR